MTWTVASKNSFIGGYLTKQNPSSFSSIYLFSYNGAKIITNPSKRRDLMRAMIETLSFFIIFMRLVGRRPRRQAGRWRIMRQLFINSLDFVHVSDSTIASKDKDGNFHEIRKITTRLNSQTYTMPYYETADRIESAIRCQHGQN